MLKSTCFKSHKIDFGWFCSECSFIFVKVKKNHCEKIIKLIYFETKIFLKSTLKYEEMEHNLGNQF